jgi:hypothetical protein
MNTNKCMLTALVLVCAGAMVCVVCGATPAVPKEPANTPENQSGLSKAMSAEPATQATQSAEHNPLSQDAVRQSREEEGKRDYQKFAEFIAAQMSVGLSPKKARSNPRYNVEVAVKTKDGHVQSVDKFTATEGYWNVIEATDIKKYHLLISATDKDDSVVVAFLPEYFYDEAGRYCRPNYQVHLIKRAVSPLKVEAGLDDELRLHYEVTAKLAPPLAKTEK